MLKSQNILNNSIFQPHSRPTFLTLRLANINLSLLNSSTECNVEKPILFHRFIPQLSILMKCSDFHLPLLAVLFGTDVVPHVKLPLRLQEKLQANNSSLDHKEHRLSVLLEWFSQFQPNSIEPLEDVINCYPFKQRTSMINSIVHGISNFICPLEETKDVMSLLNDKSYSDISRNTFTTTKSTLRSNNSFKDVIDSLQGTNVVYLWHEDYTKGWPPRLLDNFRKGKVYPISSIYSTGGAFRRAAVEDPKCPFSVYESSFLIRRLHYQVYVSLERSLGMENKLVGLNPDVIEYVRRNDKLVMYRIPIKSIPLSFGKVSTDEVIKDNLGFVTLSENNLIPNFLYSLAVVLAYWFQQLKYTSTEIPSVFSESSVGLAVAACAVANIYNDGSSSISELCEFYNNLSRMPDQSLISGSISTAFRPDIVHSFNAIQLTFNSFRDLVTTLNCLVSENRQSNHFAFSQVWILFPSGNLVHFLATQLASLDPSNRRSSVLRVWLPRLLFIRERNYDAALKLNKVVKTLTAFIDLCDMIKINIPSSLDSFYSIHELESTCFPETMPTVPKLYSSNNTNLVNERPHSSFNVRFSLGYREKSGNMTSNSRIHNKLPAENGMHSAPVRHHSSNNFHSISKKI
ncbi:unnamed protein product [Schistosoma turkestanicum]|nr:unnamed protein product [Schistosoma turkestanicum]